ncbi:hypothetical protein ACFWIY_13280 [Streptomyces sioyaensis]
MGSRGKPKRGGAKVAVIAGAATALVGAAGYGAYDLMGDSSATDSKPCPG